MIFADGSEVSIDGVVLPGIFKSIEVTTAAQIEEQEVEGSSAKPKQAIGYEDGKVNLELKLMDEEGYSKENKLQIIQNFFRQSGQNIPAVHTIINKHTALRNINQVLFKNLSTKETDANDMIVATLEFWEYIPMTISITKAASATDTGQVSKGNLNPQYQDYLGSRGGAPKRTNKTNGSPCRERGIQE